MFWDIFEEDFFARNYNLSFLNRLQELLLNKSKMLKLCIEIKNLIYLYIATFVTLSWC